MRNKLFILIMFLAIQNIFADNFISLYQYCLHDLNNYNTIGYKSFLYYNDMNKINFNAGFLKATDGFYDISIAGVGFFMVKKNDKVYYTRQGDFFYCFENNKIVNHNGFELELRKQLDEDATRDDIIINIRLFKIDVQKCLTIDNIFFEYEEIPEEDYDSSIIFGYLENSNVSAFYCLLMMKKIIHENINKIENSNYLLEIINMLINKLNTNEYNNHDINWSLIQQWIPYLNIEVSTKYNNER